MSATKINIAQAAEYDPGLYVKTEVGASVFTNKFSRQKAGIFPLANVGIGYRLNDMFRIDLTGQYKQRSYSSTVLLIPATTPPSVAAKVKVQQIGGFLNVYYDIYTPSIFTPYLTAGAGFVYITSKNSTDLTPPKGYLAESQKASAQEFVWNVGAGSIVEISKEINMTLGYRYVKGKPLTIVDGKLDISSHEITLGILYSF